MVAGDESQTVEEFIRFVILLKYGTDEEKSMLFLAIICPDYDFEQSEIFRFAFKYLDMDVEEIEEIVSKYGFGRQRTEIDQDMFQRMYAEETKSNK